MDSVWKLGLIQRSQIWHIWHIWNYLAHMAKKGINGKKDTFLPVLA